MKLNPEQARELGEALLDAAEDAEDRNKTIKVIMNGSFTAAVPLEDADKDHKDIRTVHIVHP